MFSNILIPIDLFHTGNAAKAIATAKENFSDKSKITLLSVLYNPPYIPPSDFPSDLQKSLSKLETDLKTIAKENGLDDSTEIIIKHGNPYHEILDTAEKKKSDMIVISSHEPGWEDYLIGSVASKVVSHAKCSVLVLR